MPYQVLSVNVVVMRIVMTQFRLVGSHGYTHYGVHLVLKNNTRNKETRKTTLHAHEDHILPDKKKEHFSLKKTNIDQFDAFK